MRTDYLSKLVIEDNCNCAGIFLIKHTIDNEIYINNPSDNYKTNKIEVLLVENRRKNYQFSFPKGKRNKGEHTLVAAKRELLEETGIEEKDYDLMENRWFIEYCTKASEPDVEKPHIIYYLAVLKNNDVNLCPKDTKEILNAKWFEPDDIYKMKKTFYLQRRQIVTRAIRDYKTKIIIQKIPNYKNYQIHVKNDNVLVQEQEQEQIL